MSQKPYQFYSLMKYPLPRQRDFFAYDKKIEIWSSWHAEKPSRLEISDQMKEYEQFVKKWQKIRKMIPFLEAVYIGNSMSFNALADDSDIDLLLVSNVKRLWHMRLWSVMITRLLGIKRTWRHKKMKFCLSFNVTRDHTDLQRIKLVPHDPYLIYWIAHLVPIYQQHKDYSFNIFKENSRINYYLPNHPLQQVIFLDIPIVYWVNVTRRLIENISRWLFWTFIENLIKLIWIPILLWKRKKLWHIWDDIIISDEMLKFHYDKRKSYALKWKIARQGSKK